MAHLHEDSKHFVDMPLQVSPEDALVDFEKMMQEAGGKPSQERVRQFVSLNFREPGSEFVEHELEDWKEDVEFLRGIVDPKLQDWAVHLHALWKELGRRISPQVASNPDRYSQLFVPNPVVVPGGRFREFYYWDSYWTIDGLLLSEMTTTVKGMLQNFLSMVSSYGFVPNGGRVYYLMRSQPPYLIPMMKLYIDHTQDYDFLKSSINLLEKEFRFWQTNRSLTVVDANSKSHTVFHYNSMAGGPRPESYREDFKLADELPLSERDNLYVELKSGAESGWDYSTRWFSPKIGFINQGTLRDLNVSSILPVDLNSQMCMNAHLLSQFYALLGNQQKSQAYQALTDRLNVTLNELFWDSQHGIWYDVNAWTLKKRRAFYLSNIHPLWGGCYGGDAGQEKTVKIVLDYLLKMGVTDFVGGVPTSLAEPNEQWDFPNAWAPLQYHTILGLHGARHLEPAADRMAFELSEKWIRNNWKGFVTSDPNTMFEKYDARIQGSPGHGGEYSVQIGFGWSNGVALRLLDLFGDRLTASTGGCGTMLGSSTLLYVGISFVFGSRFI